ncbi:MAG: SGNH/GDSL hydrolase family protein [Acidimicrobiaceae bacterium]|nr:SGNH/GDSL hydrolase family protein [Acidimicrobiaceae bacterium]
MKQVRGRVRAIALILIIVGAAWPVSFAGVASASATRTSPAKAFYLDLGASQSLGTQPIGTSRHGFPTNRGYANYLVALEAAKGVNLQLTELGCRGESTATMITGGDLCYRAPHSQLADAVAFLRAHQNETGLVTLELGYNNIGACIGATTQATTCANSRVGVVGRQLVQILRELRAAAGPNVTIIGLGHADPFLAWAINGPLGTAKAQASLRTMQILNHTLASVYAANAVPMVDVGAAFDMTRTTPTNLAGLGTVPFNVAQACRMTWMCRPHPLPANMHPNNSGYRAIARAISVLLPAQL